MDISQLSDDWNGWIEPLQAAFPHVKIPNIFPRAALGEAMIMRIAEQHELTDAEVREMIADLVLQRILDDAEPNVA